VRRPATLCGTDAYVVAMPSPLHLQLLLGCTLIAGSALLAGCAGEPDPPLERVRALLAEAEAAAEAKDPGALVALLSEDFTASGSLGMSAYGQGRSSASAIVSATLARHEAVHLLTRVHDLQLTGPESASATVYVAMASRPIPEPGAVASTSATLYRFDLVFAFEGSEWRVRGAEWRRAQPADLL
jgi:hypothetical protein